MIAGLAAAQAVGFAPIKLNAVAMRGVNDGEVVDLVRFAVDHGYEMRFIEQMPLDAGPHLGPHADGHPGGDPRRSSPPSSR